MEHFISIALFALTAVLSIIGVLIRGWFHSVNLNLEKLWERLDKESKAREERWDSLHGICYLHGERISKIEGRLEGKSNFMDALGQPKPRMEDK